MIMKSFGLLFYLKKRSGYVSGDLPIYMRITVDGVSKEISLLRVCNPARWNPETARMVGAKETVRALNAYLDTLQAKVYEAKHMLIQNGKPVTAEFIKNLVQGREVQSEPARMLIVVFQHHNDQMAALVGKEYAPGTLVRFKTAYETYQGFSAVEI